MSAQVLSVLWQQPLELSTKQFGGNKHAAWTKKSLTLGQHMFIHDFDDVYSLKFIHLS